MLLFVIKFNIIKHLIDIRVTFTYETYMYFMLS